MNTVITWPIVSVLLQLHGRTSVLAVGQPKDRKATLLTIALVSREPDEHEEGTPLSMSDMARYWQDLVDPINEEEDWDYFPLDKPGAAFVNRSPDDPYPIEWERLLAGRTSQTERPVLSIRAEEIEAQEAGLDLAIVRRWDIDSFLASMASLAQHRTGFRLNYSPSFHAQATQNCRVKFYGYALHKLKHVNLGQGLLSGGAGYTCHVYFPDMKVDDQTYLTLSAQETWVNDILIPALRATCPIDTWNHHPCSFADVRGKASVKQEALAGGSQQPMQIDYKIAEQYLESLWQRVIELADTHPTSKEFRHLFLITSGHNLKLFTKRDTVQEAAQDFLTHLSDIFRFDITDPSWQCWVDIAVEDTPQCDSTPVTLLRKTQCLETWAARFTAAGQKSAATKTSMYQWHTTRDAASCSVELTTTNPFRQNQTMAYNKAYNLHKELFATPLKGHSLFQHPQLEGLAYTQELMEQWYDFNGNRGRRSGPDLRAQLISIYKKSAERLSNVIRDSYDIPFGVRQEYRVHIGVLRRLAEPAAPGNLRVQSPVDSLASRLTAVNLEGETPAPTARAESGVALPLRPHKPYWILPTERVNEFVAAQTNRWLLLLEALISTTNPTMNKARPLARDIQLLNGGLVAAVLRILRYSFTGDPARMNAILLLKWKRRQYGQDPEESDSSEVAFGNSDDSDEGDSVSEASDPERQRGQRSRVGYGLGIQGYIRSSGVAWLPSRPFLWHTQVPRLTEPAALQLDIAQSRFQERFLRNRFIQKHLRDEELMFHRLRQLLVSDEPDHEARLQQGLAVASQMVVRSYIVEVIKILSSRWGKGTTGPRTKQRLQDFIAACGLTPREAAGLDGLTLEIVEKMVLHPRIVQVRVAEQARNGRTQIARYNTGKWYDKVSGLFTIHDQEDGQKRRGWDNAPFRQLFRRLYKFIQHDISAELALRFERLVPEFAYRHLWIIPQYDTDKLSVLYKASKHHGLDTQASIQALDELDRTNWVVPNVPLGHQPTAGIVWDRVHRPVSNESAKDKEDYGKKRGKYLTRVWNFQMHVYGFVADGSKPYHRPIFPISKFELFPQYSKEEVAQTPLLESLHRFEQQENFGEGYEPLFW